MTALPGWTPAIVNYCWCPNLNLRQISESESEALVTHLISDGVFPTPIPIPMKLASIKMCRTVSTEPRPIPMPIPIPIPMATVPILAPI